MAGQLQGVAAHCVSSGFAQPTLSVGVVHLGRNRRRLSGLWLAAEVGDSVRRRRGDVGGVFFIGVANVANLHRDDVRSLVAGEARLLKLNLGRRAGDPN